MQSQEAGLCQQNSRLLLRRHWSRHLVWALKAWLHQTALRIRILSWHCFVRKQRAEPHQQIFGLPVAAALVVPSSSPECSTSSNSVSRYCSADSPSAVAVVLVVSLAPDQKNPASPEDSADQEDPRWSSMSAKIFFTMASSRRTDARNCSKSALLGAPTAPSPCDVSCTKRQIPSACHGHSAPFQQTGRLIAGWPSSGS